MTREYRQKRILMVSKALTVGAYHGKLVELAKRADICLVLVVPSVWSQEPEKIAPNGYKVICADVCFAGRPHIHYYPNIEAIVKKERPDIIHIDEEHYVFVTYQLLKIAKRLKIKAIFFTWQNIYKKYPFPFSAIERSNLRNANAAIAGNEEVKSVLERKGFKKPIFVIPQFGVDESRFKKADKKSLRKELGVASAFTVGYLGRLVRLKGLNHLLKAVAMCGSGLRLIMVGDGPLRNDLIKTGLELGLSGRLQMIDHVPSIDVARYLNCMDCLVLPSVTTPKAKEQFGRVLIEAMACEVPVIGSSSGEIPNVIGDAGLIFKEGDSCDLAEKIKMLWKNAGLRRKLAEAGRERVLKKFTQRRIAEQTYQAYQWLFAEKIN